MALWVGRSPITWFAGMDGDGDRILRTNWYRCGLYSNR